MLYKHFLLFSSMGFFAVPYCNAETTDLLTQHIPEIKHDISLPLRELKGIPSNSLNAKNNLSPVSQLQTQGTGIAFKVFTGIGEGLGNYKVHAPYSDVNGSVGTTQYVQVVNTDMAVYNKTTGSILPGFPIPNNFLWKNFGGVCEEYADGNPIVKYDQLAKRWIITHHAFYDLYNGPFMQCIAVSTSDDATGSYYRYSFQFNSINKDGKLGMWPDAYYFSFNMNGPITYGPLLCGAERSKMLAGETARMQCRIPPLKLLPVDLEGNTLPWNQSPGYAVGTGNVKTYFNKLQLFKFYINFDDAKKTYLDGPVLFDGLGDNSNGKALQPGNIQINITDNLMHRATYRQFSDYASLLVSQSMPFSITGKYSSGIGWHELRFKLDNSIELYQSALFAPDGSYRYLPSIAMDQSGNIALGYTISSSLIYPSIELAYRNATDVLNTFSSKQPLVTGHGSQIGVQDWGKYSSMSLDPVDGCTFWYTNQYLKNTGNYNWSTAIIKFEIPTC